MDFNYSTNKTTTTFFWNSPKRNWSSIGRNYFSAFSGFSLVSYLNLKEKRFLFKYLLAFLVPIVTMTRGPIIASFVLAVLIISPLSFVRRLLIVITAVIIGILIFHLPISNENLYKNRC